MRPNTGAWLLSLGLCSCAGAADPGNTGGATEATTATATAASTSSAGVTTSASATDATATAATTTVDPSSDPTVDPPGSTGPDPTGGPGTDTGSTDTSTGDPAPETLAELLTLDLFEEMFPEHDPLYAHDALLAAAAEYPAFANEGSADARRREVAAFLANIGHETTGGWPDAPGGPYSWGLYFTQEVGCENGTCIGYCDVNNVQYPCAPEKTYHGRGPIQLSWNYNYGQAGDALGEPLLAQPELVATDGTIAFRTALWFWMTEQAPKPSAHAVMTGLWQPSADDLAKGRAPGFGMTINIINGGLECGQPTNAKVEDRIGFYNRFTAMLAVAPGPAIFCDMMQPY
jgi:chitinase